MRESVLPYSVDLLTSNRNDSFILKPDEVLELYNYSFDYLNQYLFSKDIKFNSLQIGEGVKSFIQQHRCNKIKEPKDIKVLLLGGPNPENDIAILLNQGILCENIYTVESNYKIYINSLKILKANYNSIKIFNSELSEFLRMNDTIFDIFYFDACGSFGIGTPNTLNPIIELLANNRLSSLSILITNFAEVKNDPIEYSGILASYFLGRYNDYPKDAWDLGIDPEILKHEGEKLKNVIQNNFNIFYSDYITRFVIDLSRSIIPNAKALSYNFIINNFLNKEKKQAIIKNAYKNGSTIIDSDEEISIERFFELCPDHILSPDSYPLYTFFLNIPKLCNNDSLYSNLLNVTVKNHNIKIAAALGSYLHSVYNGHWDLVNNKYLKYISKIWFDSNGGVFCDVPLPNLLINSYLGSLGKPYHINTRKLKRFSYKAKETRMFLDLFVLDRCNEYFDWFPSIEMTDSFMSDLRNQLLARSMIDRLNWHDWNSSSHPFWGGALAGLGETPSSKIFEIPSRKYY